MHPLKVVYNKYIRHKYGYWVGGDNIDNTKIDQLSQKISNIGMSYELYIELACTICDSWVKSRGWKYPYWSIISSDSTVERVARLATMESVDIGDDSTALFNMELEYAIGIIAWVRGESEKPQRTIDVPAEIKIKVAEYICMLAGKECTTSNYIKLAGILND